MLANHVSEKFEIHFEIEIMAPPEKVWGKLATLEGMHQWFGKHLVFEFRQGGKFQMEVSIPGNGDFTFFGEVVKIEPFKELSFTWTEHEKGQEPWPVSTLVSFRLEPTKQGTLVTFTHAGFGALGDELARKEYEGHVIGWSRDKEIEKLKQAVEAAG